MGGGGLDLGLDSSRFSTGGSFSDGSSEGGGGLGRGRGGSGLSFSSSLNLPRDFNCSFLGSSSSSRDLPPDTESKNYIKYDQKIKIKCPNLIGTLVFLEEYRHLVIYMVSLKHTIIVHYKLHISWTKFKRI